MVYGVTGGEAVGDRVLTLAGVINSVTFARAFEAPACPRATRLVYVLQFSNVNRAAPEPPLLVQIAMQSQI